MHKRKRQPVEAKLNNFHLFCQGSARSLLKQFKTLSCVLLRCPCAASCVKLKVIYLECYFKEIRTSPLGCYHGVQQVGQFFQFVTDDKLLFAVDSLTSSLFVFVSLGFFCVVPAILQQIHARRINFTFRS